MKTELITYVTPEGGIKQVWSAYDFQRYLVGLGRSRRDALANVRPAELADVREKGTFVPRDCESLYKVPMLQRERRRRVPIYA